MKANFPLGMILAAFLAVAVVGCGDSNPVVQDNNDLEYSAETVPLTFAMQEPGLRNDPYRNFRFRVEIDGISQAGFNEALVEASTVDVIEYREGNEANPAAVRKLPGRTKYGNLILKWGITDSMELYKWYEAVTMGMINRRNMSVILLDAARNDRVRWNFHEAWPVKYDAPDLDGQGNEVAIETLEIAYERVERVGDF